MPYYHSYETMSAIESKLQQFADSTFWAKSSVIVASTLYAFIQKPTGEIYKNRFRKNRITIKKKDKNTLLKLAVLSWFVDERLGFLLREEVKRLVDNRIEFWEVDVCLQSKAHMKNHLAEIFFHMSGNQIFGNFLNKDEWSEAFFSSALKVTRIKTEFSSADRLRGIKDKRTIGVGYNDKGTLPERWKPRTEAFTDAALMVRIERERQDRSYLIQFLKGTAE